MQNTGQSWNTAHTDVTSWGGTPTLIDLVRGSILLRGIKTAQSVMIQPIDGAGQPLGAPVPGSKTNAGWTLPLGNVPTTWYQVLISR